MQTKKYYTTLKKESKIKTEWKIFINIASRKVL